MQLYRMDVKEYLLANKDLKLSAVAMRMYPANQTAENYLYKKLNGQRPFTRKDALKAQAALKELGITLISLTVADTY